MSDNQEKDRLYLFWSRVRVAAGLEINSPRPTPHTSSPWAGFAALNGTGLIVAEESEDRINTSLLGSAMLDLLDSRPILANESTMDR